MGAMSFATGGYVGRERFPLPDGGNALPPPMQFTFHNDYRGADVAAVAAIQARQDRMEAELPGNVVRAWKDAHDRFVIR
jgi:hypothetical protein